MVGVLVGVLELVEQLVEELVGVVLLLGVDWLAGVVEVVGAELGWDEE